jgi:hypothetical protein
LLFKSFFVAYDGGGIVKFKKIYGYFISILLMFYLMLPTNVIADGQWKGDNFDSYPPGLLVSPPDGWQSLYNRMWSIVAGGVTGNALYFAPNYLDLFVHPSDTSDYEISVQIKHSLMPTPAYTAGLVGRRSDNYNYYSCDIYTDTSHITRLVLRKYWMQENPHIVATVVMNSIICFMGDIDPNIYYTLSMKVRGSDITATLSGMPAIPPVSVSYTDDGIKYGPVLTGGYVGIYSRAAVSFHPYFDNFTYHNLIKRPQPWLMLLLGD